MQIKRKLWAAVTALALVLGVSLVTAPAAAFAPITFTVDCEGAATSQTLVIENYSGSTIAVDVWPNYPDGQPRTLGSTLANQTAGEVTRFPVDGDNVQWTLTGGGDLNWYYRVECQHAAPEPVPWWVALRERLAKLRGSLR